VRGISGGPVVEPAGRLLGVGSAAAVLVRERGPDRGRTARLPHRHDRKARARTAGEAMTAPAVTVAADGSVFRAAALMVERGVGRLPVVDGGELVGIVTRADLVRAFARSDEEIAREIREDVLVSPFGISPEQVTVRVEDGTVTLAGEVESEGVADLLASFVRRVMGVLDVRAELSWPRRDADVHPPAPWRLPLPR
jgi:CBS domain-containing protein